MDRPILDTLTLDQIRLFVCVASEGSFSAAARRLHRAQSSVSYGIANLEQILDIRLFDRTGRYPALTEIGRGLIADARQVLDQVGKLQARAASVAEGLELDVRMAVDAICPAGLLAEFGRGFQERFPTVSLRIQTDVLEAVGALVLDGTCHIGISGPVGAEADSLERRFLGHVAMVPVAAAGHPMADFTAPIARLAVRNQVQIVISQRTNPTQGSDHGVLSGTTWRVADATTKLVLIRAGLGWGTLPSDMVTDDLARGTLVRLVLNEWGPDPLLAPLSSIVRSDASPGPASQWLLGHIEALCQRSGLLRRPSDGR